MIRTKRRNNGGLYDLALVQAVSSLIARCWSSTITRPCQLLRLIKVFCWFKQARCHSAVLGQRAQSIRRRYETNVSAQLMVSGWLIDQEHVLSCCVAATPLASDYQRHLEPIHIQCVDVDHLPRLPDAITMGRVGRQVIMPVISLACRTPSALFARCAGGH